MTLNGVKYTYETNAQGDVTGLIDNSGVEVVTYQYDSWGKLLGIGGSLASTVGAANPFRYRGYYYDTETGLYLLQSRYYDPEIGRFISKDDSSYHVGQTGAAANLYAYANNNPVMNVDPDGHISFATKKIYVSRFGSYFILSGSANIRFGWFNISFPLSLVITVYFSPLDRGDALALLMLIFGGAGTAVGAIIGTAVGPEGTAIGGIVGGAIGGIIGGIVGYSIIRSGTRKDGSYYFTLKISHTFVFYY